MSYADRYSAALDAAADAPTFATPALLTHAQRARLAAGAETVYRALDVLAAVARAGTELDGFVGLDGATARLLRSPSRVDALQMFTRFDVLGELDGDFHFVEANTADPSGIGYIDAMVRAHRTAGGAQLFDDLAASHIRGITSVASFERGCLALATDRDSPIRGDLVCLANRYRAQGIDARVVDTRELRVEDDAVFVEDTLVAALHRDLLEEYTRPPFWPHVAPLTALLARGVLPVVNPLAASLIDTKAIFEVFSSDLARRFFDTETVATLSRVIPWTRRLTESYRERALAERDTLVVKPARAYGGTGVVVGHAVSAEVWAAAVATAIADGGHVLQRAVTPRKSNGLDVVYGAWVHRGSYAGTFARVGHGAVLNVHRGGALLPVAYVSEIAEIAAPGRTFEERA